MDLTDYGLQGGVWCHYQQAYEWRDQHGYLHRDDGPAVDYRDGNLEWWMHGNLHRLDGPAVVSANGTSDWWVYDRCITGEVTDWMEANRITLPFTPEQQAEFALRWL